MVEEMRINRYHSAHVNESPDKLTWAKTAVRLIAGGEEHPAYPAKRPRPFCCSSTDVPCRVLGPLVRCTMTFA